MSVTDRGARPWGHSPPPCQSPDCERPAHFRNGYVHCLDDDCVDVPWVTQEPEPTGIATDSFRYFFGASCGSSRKTLRQLEEPNVMLSYATKNNQPWNSIQTLMVDSGGYSLLETGDGSYPDDVDDYLDYVEAVDADFYVCRDLPASQTFLDEHDFTPSEAIGSTVDYVRHTLERHRAREIDAEPIAVLQGTTPEEYVQCYHELVGEQAVTGRIAIGSLKDHSTAETVEIIRAVRQQIDDDTGHLEDRVTLHGLGVEVPALRHPDVRDALASADSSRYIATARERANRDELPPRLRDDEPRTGWYEVLRAYLEMREDLRDALDEDDDAEATAAHQGTLEGWS